MAISRSAYRRYKVIDSLLRNSMRKYPTLLDIQEACEQKLDMSPSLDTLEKDIRNMKSPEPDGFDAPIVYCRLNKGYYYENPNFSISSISLTDNDINSIKEAMELLQNISGDRVGDRFSYAIDKVLSSFKETFPDGNSRRKIIQTDYVPGARGFENFDLLFSACKNKYPLSFVHYSYNKRAFKSVIVHPVMLKEFENRWYLVGYSESHGALRTFGFDRIYQPLLLKRKYIASNSDEVDVYTTNLFGVYPIENQPLQLITIKTSPIITHYFEAYPVHKSQVIEKRSSGVGIFHFELVPTVELVRLFRSYGKELKVIEPIWLHKFVKEI
jgi:predicted DNA-binding transcriptional regulator YafY